MSPSARPRRLPEPAVVVIFGATGDLTNRKLAPALFNLAIDRLLPDRFAVVGVGRREMSDDAFRASLRESAQEFSRRQPIDEATWQWFADRVSYCQVALDSLNDFHKLRSTLENLDETRGVAGNRVFYLAMPPKFYEPIIGQLGVAGLGHPGLAGGAGGAPASLTTRWSRVVVEKPFGHDLTSARQLNLVVDQVFGESQVYRIDHYLGKETVQNILVFRFANGIFEPVWNRNYVDQVQITVAETVGLENRAEYYDETGATRDMIENHLIQLVALTAMEPPANFDADSVRDEKVKVLKAVEPIRPGDAAQIAAFGQYGPGAISGQFAPGYRDEPGVHDESTTETYVALKLQIDNWRWAGVPFYVRTGKRLPKRVSEIKIQFKRAPYALFADVTDRPASANVLTLRIQPDEGIALGFSSKSPGPAVALRPVQMDFQYGSAFMSSTPEAYERLILDCLLGDSTLFTRRDEVEAAWSLVTPLLEGRHHLLADPVTAPSYPNYSAGSWGPVEADQLLARDGRAWLKI